MSNFQLRRPEDNVSQDFEVGDLVLINGEWTPVGFNAGRVIDLNAKNVYGTDGHLLVEFGNGDHGLYLRRSCQIVRA